MKSRQRKQPSEMAVLVSAMCDEYATSAQLDRLNLLLVTDRTARAQYLRYMSAEASYERLLGGPAVTLDREDLAGAEANAAADEPSSVDLSDGVARKSLHDAWILPAIPGSEELAETEMLELAAAPFASPQRRTSFRRTSPPRRSRELNAVVRWSAAAVILLAIGLAAWFGVEHLNRKSVAIITKSVAAQWGGHKTFRPGDALPTGELDLQSGAAKLTLPGGVAVVVEGPAKFEVSSATGLSLLAGKLVATVPHEVTGFTVTTPTGSILDLGTQFGVEVVAGEPTHTEVFEGRVQVQPQSAADGVKMLSAGQAVYLSSNAVSTDPAGAMPQHFVQDLGGGVLSLDVADLVSGGDGTTHQRGGMIDPETGAAGSMPLKGMIDSDSIYHRVTSLPVIDGCFIPDGEDGPVQVDSVGHRFALPATDGKTYDRIFSGNHIPRPGINRVPLSTTLGKVNYSKPDHWFVYLHANVGLTFDLAALRRLHPGSTLNQFSAVVGNIRPGNADHPLPVELFVLADGALRFHRRFEAREIFTADVPLSDSDRDLSVIVTDGGVGNGGDDIMLGDPVFQMQPRQ